MKDETDTAGPIIRTLNQGLDLPQALAARLHEARQQALGRQRSAEAVLALAGGLRSGLRLDLGVSGLPRLLFPLLLIAAIVFGGHQWNQRIEVQRQAAIDAASVETALSSEATQQAEIDAAIVSEELPLQAYLDRDFYVWLYTPPEQSSSF